MNAILDLLETTPWQEALRQAAGDQAVHHHLTSGIGPDFVHSMPWQNIRTALDVGAGMGFMTVPLARYAKRVVAVEAVPERALFLSRRAAQDGLGNVFPIIASATALPFPPESFDLITLNGVFEYVGLWGAGDPQEVQAWFLKRARELLRPGGYLYIGIETRYALGAWLGGRDHSGLRFTSLLPRRLADWYCRWRRVPFYGSATAMDGYRTYTHSPRQYERLLRQAGFETVEVHGCFDGYNRQIAIYPLNDYRARRVSRGIVDVAGSWLGSARRWLADARLFYRMLEGEVILFARKQRQDGPLAWSCLGTPGTVAQINTGGKAFALEFQDGRPLTITKMGKHAQARQGLEHEVSFLRRLEKMHGTAAASRPLRWPKLLGTTTSHEQTFFRYEFAIGFALSKLLVPRYHRPRVLERLLRRLTQSYVALCQELTPPPNAGADANPLQDLADALAAVEVTDPDIRHRIREACARLPRRPWKALIVHGDLTVNNVIVQPDESMVLVDWENAAWSGLPALDLLRLLYDLELDSHLLTSRRRAALLARAKPILRDAMASLNIGPEDYADLEALFVAHQWQLASSRNCTDFAKLLQGYRDRTFTLSE